MGRNVGIEPTHNGTTIRRVNHFTNYAISFSKVNINTIKENSQLFYSKEHTIISIIPPNPKPIINK